MASRAIYAVANIATSTLLLVVAAHAKPPAQTGTTVSVSAPSPAAGTVTASAQAAAKKLARLEVYLDGSLKASCTTTPCNYPWNTISAGNGIHTLLAKRYDASGTVTTSAPVSVVVNNGDVTPPTVSLTAPGTIVGTVTVLASATDSSGISSLSVYLDNSPIQTVAADLLAFSWDSSGVTNGSHTFQARATDRAGNIGQSASAAVTVGNPSAPSGDPSGPELTLVDVGTGLNRVVTIDSVGLFRLVFEAADNWGLSQWYDLVHDPTGSTNLVGPACGSGSPYPCTDVTTAEPGLFQWVFYGTTPDDPKLYTRSAYYYFANLSRTFTILEQTRERIVVEAVSHPAVTSQGTLDNVTGTVRYTIYPDGRLYIHSILSVRQAQTATGWFNAIMGLEDPGHQGEVPPDRAGWIRASATQNPYTYVTGAEPYVFAYWSPNTPAPYANFSRASILLVPRAGNRLQGKQIIHSWSNFVRWGYGMQTLSLPAGGSVTQDYLIQLGTQNSSVLPNINTSAVADPIAAAYQAAPLP
jgi:hypothetical protein